MSQTKEKKWMWCMDWCKERKLAPAQHQNWNKAGIAYELKFNRNKEYQVE